MFNDDIWPTLSDFYLTGFASNQTNAVNSLEISREVSRGEEIGVIRVYVNAVQNLGRQAVAVANAILKAGLMGGHVTGFRICRDLSTNINILRN